MTPDELDFEKLYRALRRGAVSVAYLEAIVSAFLAGAMLVCFHRGLRAGAILCALCALLMGYQLINSIIFLRRHK